MKISLAINVKNGESGLEKAILSAKNIVDEIVVVINESRDNSSKIASKYTANVFFSRSKNHFGNIRNITISKAKYDWVLILDSDEYLSNELIKVIPSLTKNNDVDGYWFSRKNYINNVKYLKYGLFYPDYQLRLFRNHKGYKFYGKVHAQLNIPNEKTKYLKYDIIHKQDPLKIGQFRNYKYLNKYIKNEAFELKQKNICPIRLLLIGIYKFNIMFLGGLFRGKGILDGWDGVRAHFMFASSILLSYFFAIHSNAYIQKHLKTYD